MRRVSRVVLFTLVLISLSASVAFAQSAPAAEPAGVLAAYELARNRGDVDAALAYFSPDATISQRNTVFAGRDEIRRFLQSVTSRGRFPSVTGRRTNGNRVTWTERNMSQNVNAIEVSVEAIVQEGKIRSIVYNTTPAGARTEGPANARSPMPAVLGMGSVVLVLAGVLLVASTGLGQTRATPSSLRGRLIHDLRGWTAAR